MDTVVTTTSAPWTGLGPDEIAVVVVAGADGVAHGAFVSAARCEVDPRGVVRRLVLTLDGSAGAGAAGVRAAAGCAVGLSVLPKADRNLALRFIGPLDGQVDGLGARAGVVTIADALVDVGGRLASMTATGVGADAETQLVVDVDRIDRSARDPRLYFFPDAIPLCAAA